MTKFSKLFVISVFTAMFVCQQATAAKKTGAKTKANAEATTETPTTAKPAPVQMTPTGQLVNGEQAPAQNPNKLQNLSVDEIQIYQQGKISSGELVGGGLLGTLVGLGTGHIVYGRYSDRGWIFTVGELGSFAILSAGLTDGVTSCFANSNDRCSEGWGWYTLGALAYLGFRVWEIVDVWTLPGAHNRKYDAIKAKLGETASYQFMLYPVASPHRVGMGAVLLF